MRYSVGAEAVTGDFVAIALGEDMSPAWSDPARAGIARVGWAQDAAQVDGLLIVDQDSGVERFRTTAGLYAKGGSGALSGRVEGYAQAGSLGDASIFAWMAGVYGTFAPDAKTKPSITLWYDHLSGDADPSDEELSTFDTLWATNHKFYGQIDRAWFQFGAPDARGLQDAALKFAFVPTRGLKVHLDGHLLMPAAARDGDGIYGEEVDLWMSHAYGDHLRIGLGGAAFLPASDAVGDTPDLWGWLQLDATL